jgi:polyphosphate glucokinase
MRPEASPSLKKGLGIDIGGTGIKGAPVDLVGGAVLAEPVYLPAQPATPANISDAVGRIITQFDWHGPIGCGYPGVVKDGVALTAVHMSKEWLGLHIGNTLKNTTGQQVAVINDADAAGIAEMRFGAGRGHPGVVLVVTLGTGIGSALFCGGHLMPNTEFGHVFVEAVEAETLAAASRRTTENLSWEVWGQRVNRYFAEMEKLLTPDLIVVGGGVSENFDRFAPFLSTRARVVPATLGNNAGIIGAALIAAEPR